MARKIGVLDIHQRDTDRPTTYIKRSAAELLCRRLVAVWVTRHLIRNVAIHHIPSKTMRFMLPSPENGLLPPAELPGLKFDDPNPSRKFARFKWEYA